jgi:alcohol dehydrogenase class IV
MASQKILEGDGFQLKGIKKKSHIDRNMKKIEITGLTNEIYYGDNFRNDLEEILEKIKFENKNILLFLGKEYFEETKYFLELISLLNNTSLNVVDKINVVSNPKLEDINKAIDRNKINKLDLIIAVGGGSVLDFAKSYKLYSKLDIPIFSIYTNIGSASIVSPFVVYDNHEFKIGDFCEKIIPEIVYINSQIIKEIPEEILGAGICDIFEHSLESKLSKISTVDSRRYADSGIKFLKSFFTTNDTLNLIIADIHAGLSEKIGIVLVPHALGHHITYKYQIPHGYANFIFIDNFIALIDPQEKLLIGQFLEIILNVRKVFSKNIKFGEKVVKNLNLSELSVIKKYMGFAFDNSPIKLEDYDIIKLYNNSIKKYVR